MLHSFSSLRSAIWRFAPFTGLLFGFIIVLTADTTKGWPDNKLNLLSSASAAVAIEPPSITVQPQNQNITAPATATFSVTATGTETLSYQWRKNGAVISGATLPDYTTPATTTGANGASFTVTVTNNLGSVTSDTAILTVNHAPTSNSSPVGPVLIGGQPQNQMVMATASATFTATAIGTAPISYQWNKNGVPISGATSASYTTPPTTSADNGASFTVTVINSVNGFTSAPATLTVTSAPVFPTIEGRPGGVEVIAGAPALFYVIASGTAPLSYQWSKNGQPINNATDATYTASPTSSADNGAQFAVTVTNNAGSVSTSIPLGVANQVYGSVGFWPFPGYPNDSIGVRLRFKVATNQSPTIKIIFGSSGFYTPGSTINYGVEYNLYSNTITYANGGCTTWPLLGTITQSIASLRNAAPDYPFGAGQQPALGSAINTSDPVNWPVQTYRIDNIPNLWKSDSISQYNINGVEGFVTLQRGGTLTDISSFARCGLPMLPGTYRLWTITTQMSGHAPVSNQVVVPEANGRYIVPPPYGMVFYSEFLNSPGTFAAQYWDFNYMRESNPIWAPVSTFKTNYRYDGSGQNFGIHVVSVNGKDRIEFSNVSGNSYLPGGEVLFSIAPSNRAAFDFDNDGKTEISVFRPSTGAWYLTQSQAGVFGTQFGLGTDKITPADFDGDSKTDIAVYRPSTGIWYVLNSSNGTVSYYQFGLAEDLPTPADYDGDGKADVSVFRPSSGTWYRQNSGNGTFFGIQFGASEDKPTVGDFDGDGKSDIAVFRPSSGAWYWINSGDSSIHGEIFGFGTDVLTPADYDGDGKTDVGVFRPSDGYWYARNSSDGAFTYKIFGLATDIPAPGDFDGDGRADINVFRPSDGTWYRQNSSNGQFIAFQFGTNGDKPTMTAFRY